MKDRRTRDQLLAEIEKLDARANELYAERNREREAREAERAEHVKRLGRAHERCQAASSALGELLEAESALREAEDRMAAARLKGRQVSFSSLGGIFAKAITDELRRPFRHTASMNGHPK